MEGKIVSNTQLIILGVMFRVLKVITMDSMDWFTKKIVFKNHITFKASLDVLISNNSLSRNTMFKGFRRMKLEKRTL